MTITKFIHPRNTKEKAALLAKRGEPGLLTENRTNNWEVMIRSDTRLRHVVSLSKTLQAPGGPRGRMVVADFSALDHSIISPLWVRTSHGAWVTCGTSIVLLAGVSGGFSPGTPVFATPTDWFVSIWVKKLERDAKLKKKKASSSTKYRLRTQKGMALSRND